MVEITSNPTVKTTGVTSKGSIVLPPASTSPLPEGFDEHLGRALNRCTLELYKCVAHGHGDFHVMFEPDARSAKKCRRVYVTAGRRHSFLLDPVAVRLHRGVTVSLPPAARRTLPEGFGQDLVDLLNRCALEFFKCAVHGHGRFQVIVETDDADEERVRRVHVRAGRKHTFRLPPAVIGLFRVVVLTPVTEPGIRIDL